MKRLSGRDCLVGIKPHSRVVAAILSPHKQQKKRQEKRKQKEYSSYAEAEAATSDREGNISSSTILQSSPSEGAAATEATAVVARKPFKCSKHFPETLAG